MEGAPKERWFDTQLGQCADALLRKVGIGAGGGLIASLVIFPSK